MKSTSSRFGLLKRLAATAACGLLATTASATIAGKVFCDVNGNGMLDPGELGISGVTVTVCNLVAVTDANGNYIFGRELATAVCVPPPSSSNPYIVRVDPTTAPEGCNETSCPLEKAVQITPAFNVNFCFRPPPPPPPVGCIGDFVWEDVNDNGRQDAGEPGIGGAIVTLLDAGGNFVDATATDANGFYLFEDLELGEYVVEVTTPAGYVPAESNAAGVPTDLDSNGSGAHVIIDANNLCNYTIDFGFVNPPPPPPPTNPGTGTPGYWKNHPEAWPVDSIEIGGVVYTKAQAISLMQNPTKNDKTYNMFEQLVAALLNAEIGNDDSCVSDELAAADDWMADHPVGSGVPAESAAWTTGSPLHGTLDDYNNGELCAPSRG